MCVSMLGTKSFMPSFMILKVIEHMPKKPKFWIYWAFENFQNWISSKLLNPGFWYLICVFTWGTSLFMPNCVIVNVLEQHLCPKKQILVILRVFWAFFCWKTTLKGHIGIQNFAWWSSWASRTCMPNLMQFTKTVWL